MNWDELFGSSGFASKNIRRKADGRDYPSRLEFGLRRGIVPPASLNTGEQVERFLARVATPYFNLSSFDELPTPFRTVAVDLITASEVVIDRGSLADAMRATMSLPLVFPPVELDGRVLVDGGVMNNVPANVVRGMGADRVVAINVGELEDKDALSFTILSVAGSTLDAMTRAATKRALASADVVINVPLESFGSLDWRRSAELIQEGYKAAERCANNCCRWRSMTRHTGAGGARQGDAFANCRRWPSSTSKALPQRRRAPAFVLPGTSDRRSTSCARARPRAVHRA
jgi:NTE family protein